MIGLRLKLLLILLFGTELLCSQEVLRVDTSMSPEELIRTVLMDENASIEIENVSYNGDRASIGSFHNGIAKHFPKSGILISTGDVYSSIGPNQRSNTGEDLHGKSDFELAKMANNMSFDASALEFEFVPSSDSIHFRFVFASEEYPEYVFRGVNDVFAFFLIDLETREKTNLAKVPGTDKVVSIDNINFSRNKEFYQSNQYWQSRDWQYWNEHKDLAASAYLIEFDGYTKSLEAKAGVVAGKKYRLRIAISDIGDAFYDSAVFLEAGSFTDQGIDRPNQQTDDKLNEAFEGYEILNKGDTTQLYLPIQFGFDSYEVEAESILEIQKLKQYLDDKPSKKLNIIGHTDDQGSADYNRKLSQLRAESVLKELVKLGISELRLSAFGDGFDKPYTKETTEEARALNRRVEFKIY